MGVHHGAMGRIGKSYPRHRYSGQPELPQRVERRLFVRNLERFPGRWPAYALLVAAALLLL